MIKKLQLGLLVAVLSLAVGVSSAGAAAGDLIWSAAQTISMSSPVMSLTIANGSHASTLVVNAGTIVPTLYSSDGTFTVSTVGAGSFAVSPATGVVASCDSNTAATVVITSTAGGGQAYTITPSTTPCSSSGGAGLTTGTTIVTVVPSGGGGGGSSNPPATVTITSVTPTAMTISGCDNRTSGFSTVTGQSCSGNTATVTVTTPVVIAGCGSGTTGFSTVSGVSCAGNTGTVTTTTSYNFGTTTLRNGSRGAAVKELQRFLNNRLHLGLVLDGALGPKTIAVIKKWQKDHGLVSDGLVGPKTKAMMQTEAESN